MITFGDPMVTGDHVFDLLMSEEDRAILNSDRPYKTKIEMLAGRGVLKKYRNYRTISPWVVGKLIKLSHDIQDYPSGALYAVGEGNTVTVTIPGHGVTFSEPRNEFPSDAMVTQITLAVRALGPQQIVDAARPTTVSKAGKTTVEIRGGRIEIEGV